MTHTRLSRLLCFSISARLYVGREAIRPPNLGCGSDLLGTARELVHELVCVSGGGMDPLNLVGGNPFQPLYDALSTYFILQFYFTIFYFTSFYASFIHS